MNSTITLKNGKFTVNGKQFQYLNKDEKTALNNHFIDVRKSTAERARDYVRANLKRVLSQLPSAVPTKAFDEAFNETIKN